jgi:signal transduction histidine kinase
MASFKSKGFWLITIVYWFLLLYIIAALVLWYVELGKQNEQMYTFRVEQLKKDDIQFNTKLQDIEQVRKRKVAQYIGEGSTFLLLILICAVFVYRATRRQIRLSHQQQNFMMAITHELKTPIAVAILNLETLQKRKLDEMQQQKLVTQTLAEANRLNILTNNILVAAQLESGDYSINKQEVDFSAQVSRCVKDFEQRFPHRIFVEKITTDVFVNGEILLLQMLVNNLMDNALKYSPKDKPVTILLEADKKKVTMQVADEGAGIADEEKKHVFEKFYRVGNETTRSTKGTGLGLYLCRKIAEDHKGSITVKDNHPQGCIFTVTLDAVKV